MKAKLCCILCILLAVLTAVGLCACGGNGSQSEEESREGGESAIESGEESGSGFVESETVAQIRALLNGGTVDRSQKAVNLFAGRKYTFSAEPSADYGDPNFTKLTDGATRALFDHWAWVGFRNGMSVSIDFDLGEVSHKLAEVEVGTLKQTDYGIDLPKRGQLLVSEDGKNYTALVTIQPPADAPSSSKYTFRFALPSATTARYVRLTFTSKGSGFLFFDEAAGYEYCENGTIDVQNGEDAGTNMKEHDLYGYALSSGVTVPVSPSDADYDAYQNLALLPGADVQISHFDPMEDSVCAANSPASDKMKLIDGKFASAPIYGDAAFVKFVRGCGRHVVIDLGNEMSADKVVCEFLNQVPVGVGAPPAVMVSVSTDGENWVTAAADFTGVYGSRDRVENYRFTGVFAQACRCRYVRVSFQTVPFNDITSSVYVSEIEVWGRKNAENVPEARSENKTGAGHYPSVEEAGCRNIMFSGLGQEGEANCSLTLDAALEQAAFLDDDGKIVDTFMDSFCFAHIASLNRSDPKETASLLFDRVFAEGVNLDALEKAMGQINASLGRSEKVGVWFSFTCPNAGEKCGDVDGDGREENFDSVDDRVKFLQWQVDLYMAKMEEKGYRNIRFLGFYWNDECIDAGDDEKDSETISRISAYLHSRGLKHFWCPYYNAYGIWKWKEVGFDFACYQPNYMFYTTEDTRLRAASTIALINGLCMEIEIEDCTSSGACAIYREYLREGYDSGEMNSVKMYYHGAAVGAIDAARTKKVPYSKAVYTDTWLYAKGKLDDSFNVPTGREFDAFGDISSEVKNGKKVTLDLTGGKAEDLSGFSLRLISGPVYGVVRMDNSGKLVYSAMKGFDGVEVIVIEISDASGNRKRINAVIDVTE